MHVGPLHRRQGGFVDTRGHRVKNSNVSVRCGSFVALHQSHFCQLSVRVSRRDESPRKMHVCVGERQRMRDDECFGPGSSFLFVG